MAVAWVIVACVALAAVLTAVGVVVVSKHRAASYRRTLQAKLEQAAQQTRALKEETRRRREPVSPAVLATTLDWYILRHLEDQRRMPGTQRFLDEDRRRNEILNNVAIERLGTDGIDLEIPASTRTEGIRPPDATHYLPRYFPDEEFDSALAMFKHEMIAHRLLETISRLHLLRDSGAVPLGRMNTRRPGYTPFIPDAYVTFYNDIIAGADDFDREDGLREKMRVLALRVVFPNEEKEVEYWRDRRFEILQVPARSAREMLAGWFHTDPAEVPLAP